MSRINSHRIECTRFNDRGLEFRACGVPVTSFVAVAINAFSLTYAATAVAWMKGIDKGPNSEGPALNGSKFRGSRTKRFQIQRVQ